MKILWITNILFAHHRTMMGLDASQVTGGGWLNAAYTSSVGVEDLQLHIVTVANIPQRKTGEKDGNVFYILPGGGSRNYDIDSASNKREWERLREEIKPDAVVVWGTETRHAYLAVKTMQGLPIALYMQGVMASISKHFYEGLPYKYQCCTLRDIANKFDKSSEYRFFLCQKSLEAEMFKMSTAIIVENDWCEDMCRVVNPKLKVFRNKLPIRDVFYQGKWSKDKMIPYTIFTNAGGYPIKGHHILFKALAIVKRQYPDFKCYVPGTKLSIYDSIKRRTGYMLYLKKLIRDGNLSNNIIYTGPLSSEQMVIYLQRCNAYVMPSVVENHSSSLIEAMIAGAPCVTSLVGGVASFVEHGVNALMYNSLDAESLAGCIIRLFENPQIAAALGENAYAIRESRIGSFGNEMLNIYSDLIK